MKKNITFLCFMTAFTTGCSYNVQTTSGKEYLESYRHGSELNASEKEQEVEFKQLLKNTAKVEPTLKFPARIGLARLDNGRLSPIPYEEIEAWSLTRDKLGDSFGEFVPVSQLVASMAGSESTQANKHWKNYQLNQVINRIRLGAARQHLDAVLIYEVFGKSSKENNFLSIANVTIIGGYILPSKNITTIGHANAMLIDVIQGYPYGSARISVDKQELSIAWGDWEKSRQMNEQIKTSATVKLTGEVEKMFKELHRKLKEKDSS